MALRRHIRGQGVLPLPYRIESTGREEDGSKAGDAFELLDETSGKIKHVLLQWKPDPKDPPIDEKRVRFMEKVMESMDEDVQFTVAYPCQTGMQEIQHLRERFGERLRFLEVEDLTCWPQDRTHVLRSPAYDVTALMPGTGSDYGVIGRPDRWGDQTLYSKIPGLWPGCFAQIDKRDRNLRLGYFEGGDIQADDETVYVGAGTLRENAGKRMIRFMALQQGVYERLREGEISEAEAQQQIRTLSYKGEQLRRFVMLGETDTPEFRAIERDTRKKIEKVAGNRRIEFVGAPHPPQYHIDLYMKPLGQRRLVIGDVGMALDILGPRNDFVTQEYGDEKPTKLPLMRERLDELAHLYSERGYAVTRVPHLGADQLDHDAPNISYCNVEVEDFSGKRRVYLPTYGIEELDSEAENIWAGLGYEARKIPDMLDISRKDGSLRCSLKVLERRY